MRRYRAEIFICLLLIAITFLVFGQTVNHQFINFDDDIYVTENPHVQAGLTWKSFTWAFTTTYACFWHPLTWLSHISDYQLFGPNAGLHHLSSVLFHIANAILLFLLLRRITGALWCSAVVSLLFAVHPLHVESVAWISERKDLLSTLFWILTIWAYAWYVRRPSAKRYLLALLFFILGLAAKPMLVTLPFILLLLDYWPLARFQFRKEKSALGLLLEKIPFLFFALIAGALAFFAQKSGGAAIGSLQQYPIALRIANALVSYVAYIGKMIWPAHLVVPYPHPATIPLWHSASAALILIAISVIVIRLRFKYPYLIVGWLWYLVTLVPVIGLIQIGDHGMADRYTYVPLIGLFILIVWAAAEIIKKRRIKKIFVILFTALIIAALTVTSWIQASYWKNSITLFRHTLEAGPGSIKAHNNLGTALLDSGNLKEAVANFSETLKINSTNAKAHNNLGTALLKSGDAKAAEFHFTQALKLNPNNAIFQYNLGLSLSSQGKTKEAISCYSKALELEPKLFEAHRDLANALLNLGDINGAARHYALALKIRPDDALMCNNMGNILVRQGKVRESIRYYSRALQLKPSYLTHYNIGNAFLELGELDEAIIHFAESLRLKPDNAPAHNNLANVLARQGNLAEAIAHYRQALRIKPDFADAHCNLGLALKQQGRKKEAIAHFSEALRINPDFEKARRNLKQLQ